MRVIKWCARSDVPLSPYARSGAASENVLDCPGRIARLPAVAAPPDIITRTTSVLLDGAEKAATQQRAGRSAKSVEVVVTVTVSPCAPAGIEFHLTEFVG